MNSKGNITENIDEATGKTVYTQSIMFIPKVKVKSFIGSRTIDGEQEEKVFEYWPLSAGQSIQLANITQTLPAWLLDDNTPSKLLPHFERHIKKLSEIIAVALFKKHSGPSKEELITFIIKNFDLNDIYDGVCLALKAVGMQAFVNTICQIKGVEQRMEFSFNQAKNTALGQQK